MITLKTDKRVDPIHPMSKAMRDKIREDTRILNSEGLWAKLQRIEKETRLYPGGKTEDIEYEDVTHKRLGDGQD